MTETTRTTSRKPGALARLLLPGGVGVTGAGVVLAIAGVVAGPLFLPGTWFILLGILLLAAAGVTGIAEARGGAG
ncbi:MAG: hypothetical protein PVH00_00125 [Gemmatimonadota bacterium]|jgi:hypothetical protein